MLVWLETAIWSVYVKCQGSGKDFSVCEISLSGCSFVSTSCSILISVHAKKAETSSFIAIKEVFGLVERFSGL